MNKNAPLTIGANIQYFYTTQALFNTVPDFNLQSDVVVAK